MGRWSQNRRRGGGTSAIAAEPAHMIAPAVSPVDGFHWEITYSGAITAGNFTPGDFTAQFGAVGIDVVQISGSVIRVEFDNELLVTQDITYSGSNPEVISPDVVSTT